MKTTFLGLTILFIFTLGLTSCSQECDEPKAATCSETAPTNEACQAAFNRWFYDAGKNKCEQISYSGCSQLGFETQADCEACECND